MVFAAEKKIAGVMCSEAGHRALQGATEVKVFQTLFWKEKKRLEKLQFKTSLESMCLCQFRSSWVMGAKQDPKWRNPLRRSTEKFKLVKVF